MTAVDTRNLVYGLLDQNLVLLPELVALEAVDASYEPEEDGPPSAATIALSELPEELEDIGEEREGFPGLPYLFISPETEAELVDLLVRRGFTVWRDDDLIRRI